MNRIRQLRKALGLSQTQFGETIGVKTTIVSSWENGDREITEGRINLICKIHKVRRQWLVEGTGEMFETEPMTSSLTNTELLMVAGGEIFRNFSDEDQTKYLRFLQRLRENGGNLVEAIKEFSTSGVRVNVTNDSEQRTYRSSFCIESSFLDMETITVNSSSDNLNSANKTSKFSLQK